MNVIKIELIRPEIKIFDTSKRINAILSHSYFSEKVIGIDLAVNFRIFINTDNFNDKGIPILPIDLDKIYNTKIVSQFVQIEKVIDKCKTSSELLCNKLERLNKKLNINNQFNDTFKKYEKLDFMANKNILINILKSKAYVDFSDIIKEYNFSLLNQSFESFILDRNKYTHGHLLYWYPERKTLIQYKNNSKQDIYAEVNQDVFNSFLKCYREINEFLDKLEVAFTKNIFLNIQNGIV